MKGEMAKCLVSYHFINKLVLVLLLIIVTNELFAQTETDSLKNKLNEIPTDKKFIQSRATFESLDTIAINFNADKKELQPPTRAALFAAAVPGLGQIYNKKYWKVPLVYGGFVVFASLIDFNNVRYELFRDALALRTDGDDETEPTDIRVVNGSNDQIRRGRDRFRRDRDFNIILTFAWYGLTIADAVVDAHLGRFNISDDLSAKVRPTVINTGFNQPAVGISFSLYLGD